MTTITGHTVYEKVLLAAHFFDRQGKARFTAEDLAVAAWKADPELFGLDGYTDQHPDYNCVVSALSGARGLPQKGWLVKVAPKTYSLTKAGREVVAQLRGEPAPVVNGQHLSISKAHEKLLLRLWGSSAYRRFEENQKQELAFADACRFWDFTQMLQGEAVDARLKQLESTLDELAEQLTQEDGLLPSGRIVTAGDIRLLRNISRYMEDRFDRLLNLLRSRGGQNGKGGRS